ncbi:unnamed protein product [Mytilus coruscus]|uniref:Uncharacterized protein n=1 Tax=Mytilus coruscus TaxID=42192 RepID=A0A6J8BXN5_MYTCO|nr:unnamed protein product [Mytilus coruscus]
MDSKLKAVRAGPKSAVKRLLRKAEDDDSNLDNEESAELLETLIQKQKTISALDEDIMNSLKEDIEEEILNADEYKFFLNTKIRHIRKTFANKVCTDVPQHDHSLPSHTFENINQHSSVPYTTQMSAWDNRIRLQNAYLQAMLELRAPQNNLLSLRSYYAKLEAYIRGLESLGRSGESYGALLIPIILNKLLSEIQQHLACENDSDNWELIDLRRGILKEITILEAGKRSSSFMDSMQPTAMTASFLTSANRKGEPSKVDTFDNHERQTPNI